MLCHFNLFTKTNKLLKLQDEIIKNIDVTFGQWKYKMISNTLEKM